MKNPENSKQKEARLRREMWLAALDLFDLLVLLGPPAAMRIPVYYHEQHPN